MNPTPIVEQATLDSASALESYFSLRGRRALVTGAAQGIGFAISNILLDLGASVALADINEERLGGAVESLKERGDRVVPVLCDVTDFDSVSKAFGDAAGRIGPIDILVANAGGSPVGPFLDLSVETQRQIIDLNYEAALHSCRAVLPGMIDAAYGRIVLIASDGGIFGTPDVAVYSGAKAAVIGFAKGLAPEVSRSGITVNVISPGSTDTPLARGLSASDEEAQQRLDRRAARHPMGRMGLPEDIAKGVALFCSPAAGFITGQVLSVNGGSRIPPTSPLDPDFY